MNGTEAVRPTEQPADGEAVESPAATGPLCFVRVNGEEQGPLSVAEVRQLVVTRRIGPDTPLRRADMNDFVPAAELMDELVPPKSGPARPRRERSAAAAPQKVTFMDRHPVLGLSIVFSMILTFFILKMLEVL